MEELHLAAEGGFFVHSLERSQLLPRHGVVLLRARLAHHVRGSERAEPISGLVIKGQVRDLLGSISHVGVEPESISGYCNKSSQRIPIGAACPPVVLSECAVIPF